MTTWLPALLFVAVAVIMGAGYRKSRRPGTLVAAFVLLPTAGVFAYPLLDPRPQPDLVNASPEAFTVSVTGVFEHRELAPGERIGVRCDSGAEIRIARSPAAGADIVLQMPRAADADVVTATPSLTDGGGVSVGWDPAITVNLGTGGSK